jgi:hypothetical protein
VVFRIKILLRVGNSPTTCPLAENGLTFFRLELPQGPTNIFVIGPLQELSEQVVGKPAVVEE